MRGAGYVDTLDDADEEVNLGHRHGVGTKEYWAYNRTLDLADKGDHSQSSVSRKVRASQRTLEEHENEIMRMEAANGGERVLELGSLSWRERRRRGRRRDVTACGEL